MDRFVLVDAQPRAIMRVALLEVVPGVRKIETLVDQRKIGHDGVRQRRRKSRPIEK